jgi:hypothetical protein
VAFARLFDEIPDWLDGVDRRTAQRIRSIAPTVREIAVRNGPWTPDDGVRFEASLGLVVLEGMLIRRVEVLGRAASELLGPGDVFAPDVGTEISSVTQLRTLRVVQSCRLGVLGEEFGRFAGANPEVLRTLVARAEARSCPPMLQLAVARMPKASDRLLVVLWDLADRWGRLTSGLVEVDVPLTHRFIGELISTNREAVAKSAIPTLVAEGRVQRHPLVRDRFLLRPPAPSRELIPPSVPPCVAEHT